jgi:hypothetical protein
VVVVVVAMVVVVYDDDDDDGGDVVDGVRLSLNCSLQWACCSSPR